MMIINGNIVQENFLRRGGVFFHPPMNYSEFLKRNEDTLLIRVVGGEQTPPTA
jgi:hypothetical protein